MAETDKPQLVRFGSGDITYVPEDTINVLTQVRRDFDGQAIAELADSMALQSNDNYRLINPLTVAHFTDEERARHYVDEMNQLWGSSHKVSDMVPVGRTATYNLLVAGERRLRAIQSKMAQHAIPHALVSASIIENPTVENTFPQQFLENNARVDVPSPDEARALRRYVDFVKKNDNSVTNRAIAEKFGVSETKFYGALVYTNYPESLQKQVESFPYSWIVGAKPIFDKAHCFYSEYISNTHDYPHIGEDVRMLVDECGPEEAAVQEVITWLIMRRAEQINRRKQSGRRSADPGVYAEKLEREMREESLFDVFDGSTRELPSVEDEALTVGNTLNGRRAGAVSSLATAAYTGVELAHSFGFRPSEEQSANMLRLHNGI